MPATHRHLDHLSTILTENSHLVQDPTLSEPTLQAFFDAMALDRIRISRMDWQGHAVHSMMWHLPDLKPAAKASLTRFIVDKWGAHADGKTAPQPAYQTELSVPTVQHAVDAQPEPAVVEKNSPSALPAPRRDWFDRTTDWVAALVSLWK